MTWLPFRGHGFLGRVGKVGTLSRGRGCQESTEPSEHGSDSGNERVKDKRVDALDGCKSQP